MHPLTTLIYTIQSLPESDRSREHLVKLKRQWSKNNNQKKVPTNLQVLKTYYGMKSTWDIEEMDWVEQLLKKRSVRSESWIVAVQVLTKPFWCPWKCIFCPNDATMPKSYINTQPGAMRALLNQFDPYKQVYNRLLSLTLTGHKTDKIEMIVLWWTWDVYPKSYKLEFIKWLYDACNTFVKFQNHIDIDFSSDKSARYTVTDDFKVTYPSTVQESLKINETADHRVIWLTIETRPEYVTDENCQFWRSLWVTRVEMWIQTLHNPVHEANIRGHDNEAIRKAMHKLRQYAFKISNHYMPGLYTSTPEMDIETFKIAFSTPWIKSDELKFYPTAVIPNTPLYDLFASWEYTPIADADLKNIITTCKTEIIPPYTRIKRLARDFDTNEVVAWANTPNLRQLVMDSMQKEYDNDTELRKNQYKRLVSDEIRCQNEEVFLQEIDTALSSNTTSYINISWEVWDFDTQLLTYTIWDTIDIEAQRNFVCLCTRCREMRHKNAYSWSKVNTDSIPIIVVRRYRSSNGEEFFLSIEDSIWYLYWFARLLLPDEGTAIDFQWIDEGKALIRELHIYGKLEWLKSQDTKNDMKAQHKWYGTRLMELAADIARTRKYKYVSVISGIWVKKYYEKIWFEESGTYMVKKVS